MKKLASLLVAMLLMFTLAGCGNGENGEAATPPSQTKAGQMTVSFDYLLQSGHASNQFAVWIEDESGNLVRTLYATEYTAGGGYRDRPDSISNWVAKTALDDMAKEQIDAVTGATPKSGKLSYVWDLTDSSGDSVPEGNYTFVVEGTMRWKNYVLFSGDVAVGGDQAAVTAKPGYHIEADGDNGALTADSTEATMITNVMAEYVPAK
jgi:hypothetical protein